MTPEQWGIAIAVIVALGGGAGISKILARVRAPAPVKRSQSMPPPPTGSHHATKEELAELRGELLEAISAVEEALRTRLDDNVRDLIDRLHALALRVEGAIAARNPDDRYGAPSRRGGGR